jgi:hypothetical protein
MHHITSTDEEVDEDSDRENSFRHPHALVKQRIVFEKVSKHSQILTSEKFHSSDKIMLPNPGVQNFPTQRQHSRVKKPNHVSLEDARLLRQLQLQQRPTKRPKIIESSSEPKKILKQAKIAPIPMNANVPPNKLLFVEEKKRFILPSTSNRKKAHVDAELMMPLNPRGNSATD